MSVQQPKNRQPMPSDGMYYHSLGMSLEEVQHTYDQELAGTNRPEILSKLQLIIAVKKKHNKCTPNNPVPIPLLLGGARGGGPQ
ncbi:hypothetical protein GBO34_00935 [Roseivirga pacifica]|uniref:hypothetical protein n=1 Tax=Roseivirga pacifica TaxID=1267423 RepID=UPI002096355B|nr:hypothetical protein [Roseivirga pacifica]MCO6367878.1 hypothetical protein [Roseivirga pacifica]MCO6377250.1 hypothetical protein [Roseivirga pacifica]